MAPLPHRIRRLSFQVRAASQSEALALRKEVRGALDTALLPAMERAFNEVGSSDELIYLPRVHVRLRLSSKDNVAGELARGLQEELRRQLSTVASAEARQSAALPFGAGPAPTSSLQGRGEMLVHYLETGSVPWPLAHVDVAVAVSELREAARIDPPEVLARLSGARLSLSAQVAFWFRWLQLLPGASWPALARAAAPPSRGPSAGWVEIVEALAEGQAGALSRYARLQLAAVTISRARAGGLMDAGEFASRVLDALEGGSAVASGGVGGAERIAAGERAGSAPGAEVGVGEGDRALSTGGSGVEAAGGRGAGRPGDVQGPERSSAGERARSAPSAGVEARENDRAWSAGESGVEAARAEGAGRPGGVAGMERVVGASRTRTGGLVDVGELASLVPDALEGASAVGPRGVEGAERIAAGERTGSALRPRVGVGEGDRASSTGGSGVEAAGGRGAGRPGDVQGPERSSAGERARSAPGVGVEVRENDRAWSAGKSGIEAAGAEGAGRPGGVAGTERVVGASASASPVTERPSSSGGRVSAEDARLRAALELTARMPERAAAAFREWLVAPGGSAQVEAPAPSAAAVPGAARIDMARGGPAGPRVEQPRPGPSLAMPAWESRQAGSGLDARSAPFGQMVHHAGLVLLHPFLPRFFESTGVKEAGQPGLMAGALPRVAALLHLLAAGEEVLFELELDFIKVLVGLPLDAPLPVSEGLLRDSDREEVDALLSAVIGHWRALKSTSVRGLRGSFLVRPGLLREEEQGFRLHVEPAPFDMLLGQLPWGISTVKLSWMKKAIFTEWRAP